MIGKGKFEKELKSISFKSIHQTHEQTLDILKDFMHEHCKELDWDDWNYIMINFQLGTELIREFKDYFDLDFMNEWCLQDFIEKDKDFMREFRKEIAICEENWGEFHHFYDRLDIW